MIFLLGLATLDFAIKGQKRSILTFVLLTLACLTAVYVVVTKGWYVGLLEVLTPHCSR